MSDRRVDVYTDGACAKNPGPGGWAMVLRDESGQVRFSTGYAESTTNNEMELQAVIFSMRASIANRLDHLDDDFLCVIHSDSAYVVNSIKNKWVDGWAKNGWKNKTGDAIANRVLWEQFLFLRDVGRSARVIFAVEKVRGHNGDPMNELADSLAVAAKQTAIVVSS